MFIEPLRWKGFQDVKEKFFDKKLFKVISIDYLLFLCATPFFSLGISLWLKYLSLPQRIHEKRQHREYRENRFNYF